MQFVLQGFRKLPPALYFVFFYFFFQALFITYIANKIRYDDAELLANICYLKFGCIGGQPPLYNWLAILAVKVFGTNVLALQIVRFILLASLWMSVYGGLRLLGFHPLASSAGMLGLFLIPIVGFETQRSLTHSIAGIAGCGWLFFAFAWHMKSSSWVSAAFLGLTIAAALLGKLSTTFFIAALLLAGCSIFEYRQILFSRFSLATLIISALCLAPTIWSTIVQNDQFMIRSSKFALHVSGNLLTDSAIGYLRFFKSLLRQSFVPVGILCWILWRNKQNEKPIDISHSALGEKLIFRLFTFQYFFILISIISAGVTRIKDHWLLPLFFLIPSLLICILIRCNGSEKSLRDFRRIGAFFSVLFIPILAVNLTYVGSLSDRALLQDYKDLFHFLRSKGNFNTILSDSTQVGGNFRLLDPHINVIHFETPDRSHHIKKPLLIIWPQWKNSREELMAILKQVNMDLSLEEIEEVSILTPLGKKNYYYAIVY